MITDYRALCEELTEKLHEHTSLYEGHESKLVARARAALAQPEPVAPTVMEIIELHSWLDDEWQANNDGEDLPALDFARAVLAKWGTPAIQPVPVSERLPGPEDCDAEGRCWMFDPSDVTELFYRHMGEGSEVGFENAIAEALDRWGTPANSLEQLNDN